MAGGISYNIGWRGDLSGLQNFTRASETQIGALNRQMQEASMAVATQTLGTPVYSSQEALLTSLGTKGEGTFVKSSYDLDQYNKVLKQTTVASRQLGDGTSFVYDKFDRYVSNTDELTAAIKRQSDASQAYQGFLANNNIEEEKVAAKKGVSASATKALTAQYTSLKNEVKNATEAVKAAGSSDELTQATQKQSAANQALNTFLSNNNIEEEKVVAVRGRHTAATQALTTQYTALKNEAESATNAVDKSLRSASTIMPKNIQLMEANAKGLYNQLLGAGLGSGQFSTVENMYQNANINVPIKNMRTGMTEYSGEFQNLQGYMTRFSAEVDNTGKVITRFGGQMSGFSNMLNQTGRNFLKVIEWTIATTAVIGTLGFAMQKLSEITALDKSLRQFSLTASMSIGEARDYFSVISDVANKTATPIQEMISAMDDIALATQKAGQSASQWKASIEQVATAVGVLTNIANMTTVEATDSLTAIMKQLSLLPSQLMDIENKIAAVANGQANAISDITKGLSVMAQAGTQAQMTIDQQIGAIQVLSQVTAKTPAEVATSFKNLVGSIDSSGSIKELNKFGISVRDAAGNMRPFLDIYGDIRKAIDTGVISAGQEKEVVKAISGGPRRAPDAAALLEAYNQIAAATQKSTDATNEALAANARIVSSISAQFTVFQNKLTEFFFDKFAAGMSDMAGQIVPVLTGVLDVITGIGSVLGPLVPMLRDIVAGFIAVKVAAFGLKIISALSIDFNALKLAAISTYDAMAGNIEKATLATEGLNTATATEIDLLKQQQIAATSAGAATTEAATASALASKGSMASRFMGGALVGKSGMALGLVAGGAAIAGSVMGGGNVSQDLGNAMAALGMGISVVQPELAPFGIALSAVGMAVSLFGQNTGEAAQKVAELKQQQLDSYQSIKQLQSQYDSLTSQQAEDKTIMDRLSGATNLSTDDLNQLSQASDDYYTIAGKLVTINNSLFESYQKLLQATPELAAKYPDLASAMVAAKGGLLSNEDISKATYELLHGTNPDLFPSTTSVPQDMSKVRYDSTTGKWVDYNQPIKVQTGSTPSWRGPAQATYRNDYATVDPTTLLSKQYEGSLAWIQAQSMFNKDFNATTAGTNLQGYTGLMQSSINSPNQGAMQGFRDSLQATFFPKGVLSDTGPSTDQILKMYKDYQTASIDATEDADKYKKDVEEIGKSTPESAITWWNSISGAQLVVIKNGVAISEEIATLDDQATAAMTDLGKHIADVSKNFQIKKLSGGVSSADIAANDKYIASLREEANTFTEIIALQDSLNDTNKVDAAAQSLGGFLSQLPGMENAASLTMTEQVTQLFALADAYGLNADQIQFLIKNLDLLINTSTVLDNIKTQFHLSADIDMAGAINALEAMGNAALADGTLKGENQAARYFGAANQLKAAQKAMTNLATTFSSGHVARTSSSGSGASAAPTVSTSLLDIPDQILNSGNMNALIQKAIQNAINLRNQVPGETAKDVNDIVELLNGTKKIMEVRGISETILSKALQELADIEKARLAFETKSDIVRRIRVGAGDFSAIANVPVNSQTGVSMGGANQINVTLNINGATLTPAEFAQLADRIGASIARQL